MTGTPRKKPDKKAVADPDLAVTVTKPGPAHHDVVKSSSKTATALSTPLELPPTPSGPTPFSSSSSLSAPTTAQTPIPDAVLAWLVKFCPPAERARSIRWVLRRLGVNTLTMLEAMARESASSATLQEGLNGHTGGAGYDPDTHEGPIQIGEASLIRQMLGSSSSGHGSVGANIKVEGAEPGSLPRAAKKNVPM